MASMGGGGMPGGMPDVSDMPSGPNIDEVD